HSLLRVISLGCAAWFPACARTTATTVSIPTGLVSLLLPDLPVPLRQGAQPQRVEANEARGVAVIVGDLALLERHQVLVVERIRALTSDHVDAALVELKRHRAGNELLALVDRGLQHLALGREPEAVVDQLGVFRHQLILEMAGAAVERDLLDAAMRGIEDGAARSLVHAARLHADKAVLHEIKPADAVRAPKLIECG